MKLPPRPSRADARVLLRELRSELWLWRMARIAQVRRSHAMRVRWRLRWLAGTVEAAEAWSAVRETLATARVRCGSCGQLVRRRSRLGIKAGGGSWGD